MIADCLFHSLLELSLDWDRVNANNRMMIPYKADQLAKEDVRCPKEGQNRQSSIGKID
jgi:hypothetical protein